MKTQATQIVYAKKDQGAMHDQSFQIQGIIDSGTFGVVVKAFCIETRELVAIKKVFQDKRYKNRELTILKALNHPNCIYVKNSFYSQGDKKDEVYLNVVMDCMPVTAYKLSRAYFKQKQNFPPILAKLYTYQMLKGMHYCHIKGICHRDIKPQNVLIDSNSHNLKICDFGSAKQLVEGQENVAYICSRYYRAPELIFGNQFYSTKIDVWSIGCVVAEMMQGKPIFPGSDSTSQIIEIIKIIGVPTQEECLKMNPNTQQTTFPKVKHLTLKNYLRRSCPADLINFLSKVFIYDPEQRISARQALLDPYFNEIRQSNSQLPNGDPLPFDMLFDFSESERKRYTQEEMEVLVPRWYQKGTS